MEHIIALAFNLATLVLLPLVAALGVQYLRRMNLQITAEQEARLQVQAAAVLREVEEWASRRIKAGDTVQSSEKLDRAVDELAEKVPNKWSVEEIKKLIHATLPLIGAGASPWSK